MKNEKLFKIFASSKEAWQHIKLPIKKEEFSPIMSKETLDYHWGKLYKGYVDKANKGIGGDFQEAGAFLHTIFFSQFQRPEKKNEPHGLILELIDREFGSLSNLKDKMKEEAMKIQGSGWIYLSNSGKIKTIKNHEIKKDILLLIDWWEHAWALDYQSDKEKYFDSIWQIIDWDKINKKIGD
jgi:Fe-Mn family superoxide dismutase